MAHSLYNEVTGVAGIGYPTNRVLGTLKSASLNLPYSLEDIKISHNDFAVTEVYNDSIRKLYRNYLYLIANAELVTTSSPTSAADNYINVDSNFTATFVDTSINPASGNSLSSMYVDVETHIVKKRNSNHFVYFTYSKDDSVVVESTTEFGTIKSVLSGNFVEHNPQGRQAFKFKNVVSVDIVDEFLFVLDKGNLTLFKFDISGLLSSDTAIQRTGINDIVNPGRLLLKTLGGTQYTQIKNRFIDPVSISVYDEKIYILDNGTRSIKIYDLNFNYIDDFIYVTMYDEVREDIPVSFVIDEMSNTDKTARGYILTSKGRIFEYNPTTNTISKPVSLFESYLPYEIYVFDEDRRPPTNDEKKLYKPEGSNFKKIVNCKSSKNILYVATNRNIYKLYKTSLDTPITVLDFDTSRISDGNVLPASGWNVPINITTDYRDISSQIIASFDTVLYNGYDYMSVTTTTLSSTNGPLVSGYKTSTYLFTDKNITTKVYNDSFYTNYFTLSDIFVLPQEIVNSITFNKTTKKLIYNHYSLFENLNKKIYTYFTKANLGTSVVPAICTVNYHGFTKLSAFDNNDEFYIGVNEPLLTDVVNRPIELLYKQQEALFGFIKEEQLNTDPPSAVNTRLPGENEVATSVISLGTSSVTVTAGNIAEIPLVRQNLASVDNHASSVFYYTTLITAVQSSIEYIDIETPSIAVFEAGETELTLEIGTTKFFARDDTGKIVSETVYKEDPSLYNKTFILKIKAGDNSIVDEGDNINSIIECNITIKPSFDKYDITLFGVDSFTNRTKTGEDYTARIGVQRESSDQNYNLSAACNIQTVAQNWPVGMEWSPLVIPREEYSIFSTDANGKPNADGDFPSVPGGTVSGQVSALPAALSATSTIFFQPTVSSIVFDLSAAETEGFTSILGDSHISIAIHNATSNAIINESDSGSATHIKNVTLNEQYKTIQLHVSSISANHRVDGSTTSNLLSCVNVWDALAASDASANPEHINTFSAVSATYPISACFIIKAEGTELGPLSVISTSTDDTLHDALPAVYFKPPKGFKFAYTNNQIDIIVKTDNVIVGKGGRGGHGLAVDWAAFNNDTAGTHFAGGADFVQIGELEEDSAELITHRGVSGGPALSGFDAYFQQQITITNDGTIYGGAGGGGGGVVAVSGETMPAYAKALWFGCGGGGGGGIHAKNVGIGGSSAIDKLGHQADTGQLNASFVQAGAAATPSWTGAGGAGGYWDVSSYDDADATTYKWPYFPNVLLRKTLDAGDVGFEDGAAAIYAPVTAYPGLTGLAGGNIGESGKSDSAAAVTPFSVKLPNQHVDSTYTEVLSGYRLRVGGIRGKVIALTGTEVPLVTAGAASNYKGSS